MRFLTHTGLALLLLTSAATAGEVVVENVHLCCGACVKAVNTVFEGVEGISEVSVDKEARKLVFTATDVKVARSGLQALGKAGFGGKATHAGKAIKFAKGYKEDAKVDTVKIVGLHNCCGGCAKAISGALSGVDGVTSAECNKKSCTVTGKQISYSSLIEALHKAGLHGRIAKPKTE